MSVIAFVLHLSWEYAQCIPFFIHGTNLPSHWSMVKASIGDVILTWIAYGIVAGCHADLNWFVKKWRWSYWLLLLVTGLTLSILIEWYALKTNRWSYTELAPMLFDQVSLVPILQLLFLFPMTFLILKFALSKMEKL